MRFNFNNFQLEVLAGQLGSEESETGDRIRRNIAGHRLTWIPEHHKWVIGIGEQVLYTGINRSMEWWYLNPAVPYFFTALEEDEERLEGERDNDNSILFIFGRYVIKPNISSHFEFIVDEFQNLNFHELDSIITRVGENSRIIFSGDASQSDLVKTNDRNGIHDFLNILRKMPSFDIIEFGIDDIVRSGLVKEYIIAKLEVGL